MKKLIRSVALPAFLAMSAVAFASGEVDERAAEKLMKKSGCNKCHSLSAKKEGPPYKETAAKYKGKPDAEDKLFKHLTTGPKVEVDGKEERHDRPKSKKEDDVRNIVRYILTR